MSRPDLRDPGYDPHDPLAKLLRADERLRPRPEFKSELRSRLLGMPPAAPTWPLARPVMTRLAAPSVPAIVTVLAVIAGAVVAATLIAVGPRFEHPEGQPPPPTNAPEQISVPVQVGPPTAIAPSRAGGDATDVPSVLPAPPDLESSAASPPDEAHATAESAERSATGTAPLPEPTQPMTAGPTTAPASRPPEPDDPPAEPTRSPEVATAQPTTTASPTPTAAEGDHPRPPASPTPVPTETGRPTTTPRPTDGPTLSPTAGPGGLI